MARRIVAYGLVGLVVLPLPVGVVWLLYKAEPPGYSRPSDFTAHELEDLTAQCWEAGGKVVNTLGDKSNQTLLDVTFTDGMINGHIRTRPANDLRRLLPSWMWNPQVLFTADAVVLMADIDVKKAKTILSVHLKPRATGDGQLKVWAAAMYAGRLPLPSAVSGALVNHAERRIAKLEQELDELSSKDKKKEERKQLELKGLRAVRGLCDGEEVVIDTREFHIYLETLELLPHRLHIVGRRVDEPEPAE